MDTINTNSHENYCKKMLDKAKPKVKAFIFDFDGTIKSSSEPECLPLTLLKKIVSNGKFAGVVTASSVSVLNSLAKQIIRLISENNFSIPVYLGIANGAAFYKLDKFGKHELYSYPLTSNETNEILKVWKKVIKRIKIKETNLVEKGLITFDEFLKKDWGNHIPDDLLKLSMEFSGQCFVEKLKVTFVMPKDEIFSQERFIIMMQDEIDKILGFGKFIIDMGDNIFAHVTCKPNMAPKLFALKRIKKELGLKKEQIVAFGDMPFGNDKGLLIDSGLPFAFTNKYFDKQNIYFPPFILPEFNINPIASVYKAVDYLLK